MPSPISIFTIALIPTSSHKQHPLTVVPSNPCPPINSPSSPSVTNPSLPFRQQPLNPHTTHNKTPTDRPKIQESTIPRRAPLRTSAPPGTEKKKTRKRGVRRRGGIKDVSEETEKTAQEIAAKKKIKEKMKEAVPQEAVMKGGKAAKEEKEEEVGISASDERSN